MRQVDRDYQVVDKISEEFNKRLTDSAFLSQVFGGVLGAGRALVTGVFQFFTVMILTLFFLANLPKRSRRGLRHGPASRRTRHLLSEEIMRRTGSYAIGQVAVATINAFLSWIMMTIVGIPYAAVLAVLVGVLGLVPMVGATLGAALVCTVAVFDEPRKMIIALVYYIVYQQVENYVVVPRIMQRTVSVPGAVIVAALAGPRCSACSARCSPFPSPPGCCSSTKRCCSASAGTDLPTTSCPDPRRHGPVSHLMRVGSGQGVGGSARAADPLPRRAR